MGVKMLDRTLAVLASNFCKAAGKFIRLVFGKTLRNHEMLDLLNNAQAEKFSEDIKNGFLVFLNDEIRHPLELDVKGLPYYEHLYESVDNLNQTLSVAADILKDTPDDIVSDDEVSHDWFNRWRREASCFSDKDAQYLFARILVEEIKNPGFITLRAIDVLKNLTKNEAKLFRDILTYRIENVIVIPDKNVLESATLPVLSLDDAKLLVDAGLISGLDTLALKHTQPINNIRYFDANKSVIGIESTLNDKDFSINGYALSSSAQSLVNIPDSDIINISVLKYFFESIMSFYSNNNLKILLYDTTDIDIAIQSKPILIYPN